MKVPVIKIMEQEQQSPLHLAVMSGSVALIDKLLTLGADVMLGYKSETTFQVKYCNSCCNHDMV